MRPGPALAVWLLFAAGFAVLSLFAAAYDRFPADVWLATRLQEIDSQAFTRALDWAEDLVDTPWTVAVWLGGVAGLALVRRRWDALLLLASMLARPLNSGIKELVDRPRPSPDLLLVREHPGDPSFPSGHADSAMVLYGLLFYFITVLVRRAWLRTAGQAACLWVILFTGMERVNNGAHWPSDVLGGYYLGGLTVALIIAARDLLPAARRPD